MLDFCRRICLLTAISIASASGADSYTCSAGFVDGLIYPSGQPISAYLSVQRIQNEAFPPIPSSGRYRILEGARLITEGNFMPTTEERLMRIGLPPQSNGWHTLRFEYYDPSGKISRCEYDSMLLFTGPLTSPTTLLTPRSGDVYAGEYHNLLLMAPPELTGSNANGRVQIYDANTNEQIWVNHKEYPWVSANPPLYNVDRSKPSTKQFRYELLTEDTRRVVYRDPATYRFNLLAQSRLTLGTVNHRTGFDDSESFELQAGFTFSIKSVQPIYGRVDWYDGQRKIAEQTYNGEPRAPYFYLARSFESGGTHSYRAEFYPATLVPVEYFIPAGGSAPLEISIAAPTELILAAEGLEGATANSTIRLRARLTTRSGPVTAGQIEFALNGASAGAATIQNGIATFELRNLPTGPYRAEARFNASNGLLASRGEITFDIAAGLTIRHAASGASTLAPSTLASVYGSGLATTHTRQHASHTAFHTGRRLHAVDRFQLKAYSRGPSLRQPNTNQLPAR